MIVTVPVFNIGGVDVLGRMTDTPRICAPLTRLRTVPYTRLQHHATLPGVMVTMLAFWLWTVLYMLLRPLDAPTASAYLPATPTTTGWTTTANLQLAAHAHAALPACRAVCYTAPALPLDNVG